MRRLHRLAGSVQPRSGLEAKWGIHRHARRPAHRAAGQPGRWRPLWLIDLDNTLQDAQWRLMPFIHQNMASALSQAMSCSEEAAAALRTRYWRRYGATLLGLLEHHPEICAQTFLHRSHPTPQDIAGLTRGPSGLRHFIRRLPGEKWLLTNSPRAYALACLRALAPLGLHREFDRLISVEDMRLHGTIRPKPDSLLWHRLHREARRRGSEVWLVDDCSMNLRAAHRQGIKTARIWVSTVQRRQLGSARLHRPAGLHHQSRDWLSLIRR